MRKSLHLLNLNLVFLTWFEFAFGAKSTTYSKVKVALEDWIPNQKRPAEAVGYGWSN